MADHSSKDRAAPESATPTPAIIHPVATSAAQPQEVLSWAADDRTNEPPVVPTQAPAYHNDQKFFRLVIHFSGWTLLISVVGMILLSAKELEIPQGLVAIASGIVGLLAGVFATKSAQN